MATDQSQDSTPKPNSEEHDLVDEFDDDSTLFVGDVGRNVTEDQLRECFAKCGEVINVQIKKDKQTQLSLGYAFVKFANRQQASNAKKQLHKTNLGGRTIRIGWAQKNTNIFVGDLDPSITTEQLRDAFRPFGPIVEEETFVKQKNYGFVKFVHRAHAEKAKREMEGKVLGNRAIRIGWGDSNTQKHCVHVQFNVEDDRDGLSEAELRKAFSEFGEVTSISMPRQGEAKTGFAFVYYEDSDEGETAASNAIHELNNTVLGGARIKCNFGKKQSKHMGGVAPKGGKYQQHKNYYPNQRGGWQQMPYQPPPVYHSPPPFRDGYCSPTTRRTIPRDYGYQSPVGSPRGGRHQHYQPHYNSPHHVPHQHQHYVPPHVPQYYPRDDRE